MTTALLLAHPNLAASRANRALLSGLDDLPGLEIVDLYAAYPDEKIDLSAERDRLLRADRLVLQFPMFWYSTPPLLKRWQDVVLTPLIYLEPNTASLLKGLPVMAATTTGGPAASYRQTGMSIEELFAPLKATARKARWEWQTPFALHDVRALDDEAMSAASQNFRSAVLSMPTRSVVARRLAPSAT
ncbi:NAD(P)H-dependent oxidoreductase [Sphingomonas sp. ID0503]|uniref:NAD(P)H-dependent oxidoreductase n=1 Tax=Sphingomonas sp. ID0503 TaxID=3399691 RepID=UPI003AFA2931